MKKQRLLIELTDKQYKKLCKEAKKYNLPKVHIIRRLIEALVEAPRK